MNKKVFRIGKKGDTSSAKTEADLTEKGITPMGGFPHYGFVNEDWIMIKGCCVGIKKRCVTLRKALMKFSGRIHLEEINLVSVQMWAPCMVVRCMRAVGVRTRTERLTTDTQPSNYRNSSTRRRSSDTVASRQMRRSSSSWARLSNPPRAMLLPRTRHLGFAIFTAKHYRSLVV